MAHFQQTAGKFNSSSPNYDSFKAGIVGCGSVGSTIAYNFLLSGTISEMALVDANADKARGLLLDLEHSLAFTPNISIISSTTAEICVNSDLIIVTAGARQKEGQTRLDLVKTNKKIFDTLIPQLVKSSPDAIFLIVTNPVDVLTHHALKISGLPWQRVFGSGTLLDSARLQFHISEKIGIHPSSIHAFILGEHGDTSFPVFSSANVAGKPLFSFPDFDESVAENCYQETKNAAYRIIHDQGYTCYSIATAVREIADSIFENQHKVIPLSVLLKDYYDCSDVCLSVPCVLGRGGIEQVLEIPLSKNEQQQFQKSAEVVKKLG